MLKKEKIFILLIIAMVIVNCSKSKEEIITPPKAEVFPAILEIISGNNQIGIRGSKLKEYLSVVVKDNFDNKLKGISVHFLTEQGNGFVDKSIVETNFYGQADVIWTLGDNTKPQSLEAVIKNDKNEIIDKVNFIAILTDCANVIGGSAYIDNCNKCVEGTTLIVDCSKNIPTVMSTKVLTESEDITAMALNGNDLYFTVGDNYPQGISKIDITEAIPIVTNVITLLEDVNDLIIKDNYLYFVEPGSLIDGGKISRIDLNATTPIVETLINKLQFPYGLALNDNNLYFSDGDPRVISKIDITATIPTAIQVNQSFEESFHSRLLINENDLYYTESHKFCISKVDIRETTPISPTKVIVGLYNFPKTQYSLALKENNLYFSHSGSRISKIDISTTTPITTISATVKLSDMINIDNLLVNGDDLYFSHNKGISKLKIKDISN